MKGVTYKIIGADGREYGPVNLDEIRDWIVDGRVGPSTRVWESEDGQWLPASERDQLRWDLPALEAPPVLAAVEESTTVTAPLPLRFAAFAFDFVVVSLLVSLVSLPWAQQIEELQNATRATLQQPIPDLGLMLRLTALVLGFHIPVSMTYHVGFNSTAGATPGKRLVGLRIVRGDGAKLSLGWAIVRFLAEALSQMSFGAGYLLALFNPSRQTLHDLIAGTRVVRATTPRAVVVS